MKKVFVFLTFCLFYGFTFVSVSEHDPNINRTYHKDLAIKTSPNRTSKSRHAKDVDGPLMTKTRTEVVQYADEPIWDMYKKYAGQHHWRARSRVKNSNPLFKGHYYHEVVFPYAPANTVMVDPPVGVGNGKAEYEGIIDKILPDPSDAYGVVTTTVPYDVNTSINQCEAWASISGALYDPRNPPPAKMTHVSMSSIPWWYEESGRGGNGEGGDGNNEGGSNNDGGNETPQNIILSPSDGSSTATAGSSYTVNLSVPSGYTRIHWYIKSPSDAGYGTTAATETGNGSSSTSASYTYTMPSDASGDYVLTAYIYLSDNTISEASYTVTVTNDSGTSDDSDDDDLTHWCPWCSSYYDPNNNRYSTECRGFTYHDGFPSP